MDTPKSVKVTKESKISKETPQPKHKVAGRGVNLFKKVVNKQIFDKKVKKAGIFGAFTNMIEELTTVKEDEENK